MSIGHWEEKEKENLEETTSKPIERAEEVTISYDDVVTEYEEVIGSWELGTFSKQKDSFRTFIINKVGRGIHNIGRVTKRLVFHWHIGGVFSFA